MTSHTPKSLAKRFIVKGTPIVAGFAVGRVAYYRDIFTREVEIWKLSEGQVAAELDRLRNAMDQADSELSDTKAKVTYDMALSHAEIFGAHPMILKNRELFK